MADDDLSLDGLPEETVKYIKQLRTESARYRTERNSLNDKYTQAGDLLRQANEKLDEYSAVKDTLESTVAERTELQKNYDKLRAAAKYGIPDEVDRLKGSKYEEWEKDAEDLASKLGNKKPTLTKDPAAGKNPDPATVDPIVKAFQDTGWL